MASRKEMYANRNAEVPALRGEAGSAPLCDATLSLPPEESPASAAQVPIWRLPVPADGRCGPYRLVRLIGTGDMGAVYLAERADGEVEQKVAIRFVRFEPVASSFRARFLRERRILATLNHPGIVRLLDAGHSAGIPYLAMEYVEGIRIDKYTLGLDIRAVVGIFLEVADAVSYAHRKLVIHRDLKPSSILVDRAGHPRLLDFRIARLVDDSDRTSSLDRVLTQEYASPEQIQGGVQTTSTDIYSLGAVLYRLLTGESPGDRRRGAGRLPGELSSILAKAMRDEPEERYASVEMLAADLRAWLAHRPVEARRGNVLYVARKFIRRRWIPIAAAAFAAAGLAAVLIAADRQRTVAEWRREQVRRLSKEFLELDSELRNVPGSTKARNRIVSRAAAYLDGLSGEADPNVAMEVSRAYLQVARVQGIPGNLSLGQFEAARRNLSRASALIDRVLSDRDFGRRRPALLLAANISAGEMILSETEGRAGDALTAGRKVAANLEGLLATGPDRDESVTAARLYAALAQTYSNLHEAEEAARFGLRSVAMARAVGDDKRLLIRTLSVYANTARFSGDLNGALRAARESRRLAEESPDLSNAEHVLGLCGALWREALILGERNNISLDRPQEAIPLLEKDFELAEEMARRDPHDYSSRSYVSMAGRELGDLLRDRKPARALAIYDQARRRLQEVPNNAKARQDEVWILAGSAYALRRLGRNQEAQARIDAAMSILANLRLYPAASVSLGEESDVTLRARADHLAATGRTAAAVAAYEDLRSKVLASEPQPRTDLRHANSLSRLYRDLGDLYRRSGRNSEADALLRERLDLWRHWDGKLPDNPFVRRQLSEAQTESMPNPMPTVL